MFSVGRLARQREREQTEFRELTRVIYGTYNTHQCTNQPPRRDACGGDGCSLLAMMMLFAQTVARWDPELRAKQRSEGARGGALPRGLRRRAGSTLGSTIRCPVRFALSRCCGPTPIRQHLPDVRAALRIALLRRIRRLRRHQIYAGARGHPTS